MRAETESRGEDSRSDEDLIEAYYGCDDLAFEVIYKRWFPRLYGYFRNKGCSSPDAEDLAENVLVKVAFTKGRPQARFDRRRAFRPWIFTIAWHLLVDTGRPGEPPPISIDRDTLGDVLVSKELSPEDEVLLREALEECLRSLSSDRRQVLILHDLVGLSLEDIASIMGKTVDSVRNLLYRARDDVRDCMSPRPAKPGDEPQDQPWPRRHASRSEKDE